MRYIENEDPFLIAAQELVDDLAIERARHEGRLEEVEPLAPGLHVVDEEGQVQHLGPSEDVLNAAMELGAEMYESLLLDDMGFAPEDDSDTDLS